MHDANGSSVISSTWFYRWTHLIHHRLGTNDPSLHLSALHFRLIKRLNTRRQTVSELFCETGVSVFTLRCRLNRNTAIRARRDVCPAVKCEHLPSYRSVKWSCFGCGCLVDSLRHYVSLFVDWMVTSCGLQDWTPWTRVKHLPNIIGRSRKDALLLSGCLQQPCDHKIQNVCEHDEFGFRWIIRLCKLICKLAQNGIKSTFDLFEFQTDFTCQISALIGCLTRLHFMDQILLFCIDNKELMRTCRSKSMMLWVCCFSTDSPWRQHVIQPSCWVSLGKNLFLTHYY